MLPSHFQTAGMERAKGAAGEAPALREAAPKVARTVPRVREIRHKHPSVTGGCARPGGRAARLLRGPCPSLAPRLLWDSPPPSARPRPVIARPRRLLSWPQKGRERKEATRDGSSPGPLLPGWRLPLRPDPPGWAPSSPAAFHARDADGRGGPARRARENPRKVRWRGDALPRAGQAEEGGGKPSLLSPHPHPSSLYRRPRRRGRPSTVHPVHQQRGRPAEWPGLLQRQSARLLPPPARLREGFHHLILPRRSRQGRWAEASQE